MTVYDRRLDCFVLVVECGSFAQAAAIRFVSSNALIKQVNGLERDLDVDLLVRTHQGVTPTPAGRYVYTQAKKIIEESNLVAREARRIASASASIVRISTSQMRPARRICQIWDRIRASLPDVDVEAVQIPDDVRIWKRLLDEGNYTTYDVLVTIKPDAWKGCGVLEHSVLTDLYSSPQICAVPAGHRLRGKSSISLNDLHGERVWLVESGSTSTADDLRRCIRHDHPQIEVMDYRPYHIADLNQIARSPSVAIVSEEWANVHPTLESIPLEGGWTDVVCLASSASAPLHVRQFVKAMGQACARTQ